MARCSSCVSEIPDNSHFCLSCGASVNGSVANGASHGPGQDTLATVAMAVSSPSLPPTLVPSSVFDEGRFIPGTLISERYRIIARLGRGGMGDVYRANDIRLGQTVALKFLPDAMVHDPGMLARFHNEVRTARQVTHPNVCRVYDIGEVDGQPFISMEFIDGEDLATLLRRIGRLPQDKAIEIARRLCAGLAAAHSQGVLHRDLKPANVMIDGRGQVVIADFGLAGLAEHLQGAEARNGTPAYMAPEQLTGKEVSVKSDIYALGLVLYEMFTGKPAHRADTLAGMLKLREESRPEGISTLVRDIDPAVEKVILRCLEPDPKNRPSSALAVSAALPGGDPLAAALAAGETPSPEMVAGAGTSEGLQPRTAILCLSAIVLGLIAIVFLHAGQSLAAKVNLELPPEALAIKARTIIRTLGYTAPAADRVYGIEYNGDYLRYLGPHVHSSEEWAPLANGQPPVVEFWYRESPRPLLSIETMGRVNRDAPPLNLSGMLLLSLDFQGRLVSFEAVPPQVQEISGASKSLDSAALFAAAGLDLAQFHETAPQWLPPGMADSRAAWTGTFPNRPQDPIRIEAAWWQGKPVYFQMVGPWSVPHRMQPWTGRLQDRIQGLTFLALFLITGVAALFMARQNLRQGRGDRKGALRLAALAASLSVIGWLFGAHHRLADDEIGNFFFAMGFAFWQGAILWLLYLALEPHVRRRWPQTLISWTRILSGRLRDPLVGRDVLIGVGFGALNALLIAAANVIEIRLGDPPPRGVSLTSLLGFPALVDGVSGHLNSALQGALFFFFLIFLLRVMLRRQWLAAVVFTLIFVAAKALPENHPAVEGLFIATIYGLIVFSLMRFGLVTLVISIFVTDLLPAFVFTTSFNAWYGNASLLVTLALLGLAAYGFRTGTVWVPKIAGHSSRA